MHQIKIDDRLYDDLQRRAAEAGFASVDEYVADLLQAYLEQENLDRYFTPERLAHIDRAAASIDAGQGIAMEEFDTRLAELKDQWQRRRE